MCSEEEGLRPHGTPAPVPRLWGSPPARQQTLDVKTGDESGSRPMIGGEVGLGTQRVEARLAGDDALVLRFLSTLRSSRAYINLGCH